MDAFVGRTVYDAPEIDDFVILTDKDMEEGRIYKAKIYNSDEEKLFAKVIR